MSSDKSISIGRDAIGNVISTGDSSRIYRVQTTVTNTTLPPSDAVNISQELAQIRTILHRIGSENAGKIGRALDDAVEEAKKPEPNKDEIGAALTRALEYAKTARGFAEELISIAPHVKNAVCWLGANWHKLLSIVGLSV
jgi:hypothetical protein